MWIFTASGHEDDIVTTEAEWLHKSLGKPSFQEDKTALGSVCALLLSEEGPAILAGVAQVARHGWPAVALAVSLVAFAAIVRALATLQQTNVALHGFLTQDRVRIDRSLTRVEENQEEPSRTVEGSASGAERTAEGVAIVHEARAAFERLGTEVDEMVRSIEVIARGTADVAAVAEQSSAATQQVSASTEQTSASASEIAASANDLAGRAEGLQALVRRFLLS